MATRIDVIFDVPPGSPYHEPTLAAIDHAATAAGAEVVVDVVRTEAIGPAYLVDPPHGVVIGPGTPYDRPGAAEEVIRTAREKGLPLVAT